MVDSDRTILWRSMRLVLLQALGVAIVGGCSDRPIDPDVGTESESGASTSTTGVPGGPLTTGVNTSTATSSTATSSTATSSTATSSTATSSPATSSTATSVGTGPGDLPCQPENYWEGVVCYPKISDTCGPCDEACLQSPETAALAEEAYGGACCFYEATALCGPAASDSQCCYVISIDGCGCDGRPLVIDGVRQRASVRCVEVGADAEAWIGDAPLAGLGAGAPAAIRAAAGERWLAAALDEHASIAAFARLVLELLGLGAPASSIREVQAALADEVEHARSTFAVAASLSGSARAPAALPAALAGGLATSHHTLGRATFDGGCVGEGIAAARASVAARACDDPRIRAILTKIAADELRHAALAWQLLRWALEAAPVDEARALRAELALHLAALEAVDDADLDDDATGEDHDAGPLARLGCLSPATEARIAAEVRTAVIAPCLRALLDARPAVDSGDPRGASA